MRYAERAHVYFRQKGESDYRDLGTRRMTNVPREGGKAIVRVDRKKVRARVVRVDKFVGHEGRPAKDPNIYLEAI